MDVSTDCFEHSLVCRHGIFVQAKVPALTVLTVVSEVLSLACGLDPLPIDTGRAERVLDAVESVSAWSYPRQLFNHRMPFVCFLTPC